MVKMKFRHGDLMIIRINKLSKNLQKVEGNVLAKGEVTGHLHQLLVNKTENLQLYKNNDETLFFETKEEAKLIHQEHKQIQIPKGIFRVMRQREYSAKENRQVMD